MVIVFKKYFMIKIKHKLENKLKLLLCEDIPLYYLNILVYINIYNNY